MTGIQTKYLVLQSPRTYPLDRNASTFMMNENFFYLRFDNFEQIWTHLYASATKKPETLCFRVIRLSVLHVLVIALSHETIDGFPPNSSLSRLIKTCTTYLQGNILREENASPRPPLK